jgi:predicted dehydrogenase
MVPTTRRRFIEETILAAMAVEPARVLLAAENQPESPGDRLGIAVVGAGSRGPAHARAFAARRDCEVLAICDADRDRGNRLAAATGKVQGRTPRFVQDLRHIMDDPSVDCVSIASCNHWHALCAVWAMQAGKDVYVEKPVSHNVSEGRRIVQAARKYGRICQVGTQRRSDGSCKAAAAYLAQGKLGTVTCARSITYKRRGSIGPTVKGSVPKSVDYNLWAGPAPMSPITRQRFHYDWHWFWETGNGDLGNSDVHRADLVRWGLGVRGLSRAVLSYGARVGYADAAQTPNTQIVIHDFGGTTFVQEVRGLDTPPFRLEGLAIFAGTGGYVAMNDGRSALFDTDGKKVRTFVGHSEDHFGNFVKAVRSRKREDLNADILGGHLSSGLCHLGNISYRLGRPASPKEMRARLEARKVNDDVRDTFERTCAHLKANGIDVEKNVLTLGPWLAFDPETETFTGNTAADAMLSRDYREPFVLPGPAEV